MKKNEISVTYYAEHTDDPKSWASPRPSFDLEKFNKELVKRTGMVGTIPRYRCRWAGELEQYLLEEYQTLEGYHYRENGIDKFVSVKEVDFEFPDGSIPSPHFETHLVFVPRFVLEEYDGHLGYNKLWFVERLKKSASEFGRVDMVSTYREPAEIDIRMVEELRYQRDHLNADDIRNGLARQKELEERRVAHEENEFKAEIASEVEKALVDGLPNASKFAINPNLKFDIKQHTKNLIKEHDKKL